MDKVALLSHAVESEVKGEPVDKALADGLVEHFGLEAEQYLGEHPGGPYSDAEVMALGLYTNGEYQHLNRSLRQGRELDAGQALIDRGMSAAFEKSGPAEQVVKTFRGTQGRGCLRGGERGPGRPRRRLSLHLPGPQRCQELRGPGHDNHPVRQIRDRCQRDIDRGR